MKKNQTMRLATLLLVLALLTVGVIGGTLAKFTTKASGKDSARVAAFGVTVNVEADGAFDVQYATDDTDFNKGLSVQAREDVVAPGTKGALTFSIKGTPEVATKVEIVLGDDSTAVKLDSYEPIKFYVGDKAAAALTDADYTLTLDELKTALADLNAQYEAGNPLDAQYTVAWSWPFDSDNDVADTALGDAASAQEIIDLTVTVTQID